MRKRRGVSHTASPNVLRTEVTLDWSNDRRVVAIWNRTRSSAVYASVSRRRKRASVQADDAGHNVHAALTDARSISVEDLCEHLKRLSLRSLDADVAVPPSDDDDGTFEALIDELCQLMSRLTLADDFQGARPPPQSQAIAASEYDEEAALLRKIAVRFLGISAVDKEFNRLRSIAPDILDPHTLHSESRESTSSIQHLQTTYSSSSESGVAAVSYMRSFLPLLRLSGMHIVTSVWAPAMRSL
ncbi:hypothetical protein EIP86_002916 [Pleurotus ostreatoroseus]|nr:hypothetical protein EIP86_002916 [Pleurotus ostreatoroseus]